ncbi:MAG: hypothetical protein DU429_07185 [Candidatus Tokpelaia sp.]|nr:MAG: hypothetical protein DU429_07185 [Candidatus Tokpelaia sp.]KAA6406092.1 hypothetical protein DPQ22_01255 [Candidatus Tokpelaia sp.]
MKFVHFCSAVTENEAFRRQAAIILFFRKPDKAKNRIGSVICRIIFKKQRDYCDKAGLFTRQVKVFLKILQAFS